MLFRFKGDYTGKRTSITLYGATFEGGGPADVTDPDGIRRLSNHPEFEAVTKTVTPPAFDEAPDELEDRIVVEDVIYVERPKKRGRPRKGS